MDAGRHWQQGQHLYGLFQSKEAIRQKKFAILVEGYLDLIALYQFGITNVAASLGTAFTPEQSRLLSRFTKKVVINYDGDSAGIKAARRAIEELLPNDFEIKVLVLPAGQDPDDFVRANGTEAYNEARGRAATYLDFVLDVALSGRSLANPKHKNDALEEVLPVLSLIRKPIEKRDSFETAMDHFIIDDEVIRRTLWLAVKNNSTSSQDFEKQIKKVIRIKPTVAEQNLLDLLLHDKELRSQILPLLEATDYEGLTTASIYQALIEMEQRGLNISLESLTTFAEMDEESADLVAFLMIGEAKRELDEALDEVLGQALDCLYTLRKMAIVNRVQQIAQEALHAQQTGDVELFTRLTYEQIDLEKMRHALLSKIRET